MGKMRDMTRALFKEDYLEISRLVCEVDLNANIPVMGSYLMIAVLLRSPYSMRLLLEAGADPSTRFVAHTDFTPSMYTPHESGGHDYMTTAVRNCDLPVIKVLVEYKCPLVNPLNYSLHPLMMVASFFTEEIELRNSLEVAEYLLQAGVDPNYFQIQRCGFAGAISRTTNLVSVEKAISMVTLLARYGARFDYKDKANMWLYENVAEVPLAVQIWTLGVVIPMILASKFPDKKKRCLLPRLGPDLVRRVCQFLVFKRPLTVSPLT